MPTKEEIQQKLDESEDKLDRVRDILSEDEADEEEDELLDDEEEED